jgi:hypothetical protein
MRKNMTVLALLAAFVLACACPVSGGSLATIGAMGGTIGAALTEMPGMMTELPALMTELPATMSAEAAQPGIISGHLSYPSEFLPAQRIVAFRATTMAVAADVTTAEGQGEYELSVAAGDYFVVAYTTDGQLSAGYSQAVPCGLLDSCKDHSLIPVHVDAGATVTDIDPQDWYAPPGTFPAMP